MVVSEELKSAQTCARKGDSSVIQVKPAQPSPHRAWQASAVSILVSTLTRAVLSYVTFSSKHESISVASYTEFNQD